MLTPFSLHLYIYTQPTGLLIPLLLSVLVLSPCGLWVVLLKGFFMYGGDFGELVKQQEKKPLERKVTCVREIHSVFSLSASDMK